MIDQQQIEALVAQEVERQQAGIAAERDAERVAAEQKVKEWRAMRSRRLPCRAAHGPSRLITSWSVPPRYSNSATVVWPRNPA